MEQRTEWDEFCAALDRVDNLPIVELRSAWEAGIASGDAGPLDFAELRAVLAARVA